MAQNNTNGVVTIEIYTKDGCEIDLTKPECTGMAVIESSFDGAGPEREEYEGNKRYPFPNVKSEPFMHAVGAASFNYESKTKDSSSSLKDATDYGKGFLKSLSPLMRTELLEVAQIMKFADVVQLISTLMPEIEKEGKTEKSASAAQKK